MKLSADQILRIFQDYVENDLNSTETAYIRDALRFVATDEEIEALGFGWLFDYEMNLNEQE